MPRSTRRSAAAATAPVSPTSPSIPSRELGVVAQERRCSIESVSRRRSSAQRALLALALLASSAATGRAQTFGWDKARDATSRRYREVLDLSGLAAIGFQIPANLDPADLEAVCQTRRQGMLSAGQQAQSSLKRLGDWRDPITDAERARLHRALASVAAFSGDIDTAVQNLEAARQDLVPHVESYPDLQPSFLGLQEALGVAYMRQAEIQNCLVNPGADRCLFPLRPGGIHHRAAGAEAARGLFEAFLAKTPSDLEVRWLLNLSAMVLGRYPEGVPKAHLLPPSVFRSEARRRASSTWPPRRTGPSRRRRRHRRRRLRRRRLRRRRVLERRSLLAAALLPQPRRRHLRGPHRSRERPRAARRPQPRADRLRQRRPARPVHPCAAAGSRRCATRCCATRATAASPT